VNGYLALFKARLILSGKWIWCNGATVQDRVACTTWMGYWDKSQHRGYGTNIPK
jgi:hypothetical protein